MRVVFYLVLWAIWSGVLHHFGLPADASVIVGAFAAAFCTLGDLILLALIGALDS